MRIEWWGDHWFKIKLRNHRREAFLDFGPVRIIWRAYSLRKTP